MKIILISLLSIVLFAASPPEGPIRVLVLLGGEYHPYEAGAKLLTEAAQRTLDIEATFVRLDHPPPGKPEAEKATIVSNPGILEDPDLNKKYDVIFAYHQKAWISLTDEQSNGYLGFVRNGGGLVAIHSSCDPITSDTEYVKMIGARFVSHEPFRVMTVRKADRGEGSPILDGVADEFETKDEFYYVEEAEGEQKHLLLTSRAEDGTVRPIAWTKGYGKGRAFCTILGHNLDSHQNTDFQWLVRNALNRAAGRREKTRFVPLFNGADADGWKMMEQGGFRIENGVMRSHGGMGLLWYSRKKFRDFVLLVEWKVNEEAANSGVFLRIPEPPKTFWDAVNKGYEVQICDTNAPERSTAAIFDFKAPSRVATRPSGQWNLYEISVVGNKFTVVLNGEKVNEFVGNRAPEGYIGLQNHDAGSIVEFRRIEIKPLPAR